MERVPIIGPLFIILKSTRFLTAVSAILTSVVVLGVPELAGIQAELLILITVLTLALIGGYSVKDAEEYARENKVSHKPVKEQSLELFTQTFLDYLEYLKTHQLPTDKKE